MQLLRSPARPQSIRFRVTEVSAPNATGLHGSSGKLGAVVQRICARIGLSRIELHAPLPLRTLCCSGEHLLLVNHPLKSDQRDVVMSFAKNAKATPTSFGALAGR